MNFADLFASPSLSVLFDPILLFIFVVFGSGAVWGYSLCKFRMKLASETGEAK